MAAKAAGEMAIVTMAQCYRRQLSDEAEANKAQPSTGHDFVLALKPPRVLRHLHKLWPFERQRDGLLEVRLRPAPI